MESRTLSRMIVGKRGSKPYWVPLELNQLEFSRPTVLCLSGNRATTNEQANGFAKMAENYLDLLFKAKDENGNLIRPSDKVDILGVRYAEQGVFGEVAIEQLVRPIFHLLVDAQGQRLPLVKAKQQMARLTFFTYCAGNLRLQRIITRLNEKLARVGYTQEEIYAINGASLEVSYAPHNEYYNTIPSVRIISKQDDFIGPSSFATLQDGGVIGKGFDGIQLHEDVAGSGKLYGVSRAADPDFAQMTDFPVETVTAGSIQIISSKLVNTCHRAINEHNVGILRRDSRWQLQPVRDRDGLSYTAPNADCVSQMAAWALCKGVENSVQNFNAQTYVPNTYWNEMMADLQSILDSYNQQQLSEQVEKQANLDLGLER